MKHNTQFWSLCAATFVIGQTAVAADNLESLAGKWSVKKVSDQGQDYTQTITVKGSKFIFQIIGGENRVVLYSEGDLKLDQLGPFNVAHFVNIRAGQAADDLRDVDDEFVSVYTLDGDTWTMAFGFDKQRERWKPTADKYQRVKSAEAATLVIDAIEMTDTPQSATWFVCFEASVEGVTRNYHVAGKGYDKNQVSIPLALELPKAEAGKKCRFKVQLDDVDDDVCTEEVDNRSTGEFVISDKGAETFKPEDHWRYTIRWHLK